MYILKPHLVGIIVIIAVVLLGAVPAPREAGDQKDDHCQEYEAEKDDEPASG